MSLRRIEGWEARLAGFVQAAAGRPFVLGSFDCCLMPCEAVEAMTGVDPLARLRGRYKTELGALRVLRRFAGGGVVEMFEKIAAGLAAPEVPIPFARRGDICLITEPNIVCAAFGAGLGLCLGREAAIVTLDGFRLWPMARAARAWEMG